MREQVKNVQSTVNSIMKNFQTMVTMIQTNQKQKEIESFVNKNVSIFDEIISVI